MKTYRTIDEIVKELSSKYVGLTMYELLDLAVKIQRNDLLIEGLSVSNNKNQPSALAEIANNMR